jgi:hypothetical protein
MSKYASACGSCGALIWWLAHEKTGKPAPIECEPSEAGNIIVNLLTERYRMLKSDAAQAIRDAYEGEYTPPLHFNHFARCPQSKSWRKAVK